jgi:hypothetical protein
MEKRMFDSLYLLLSILLCPANGCLCEGRWGKIVWQSWLQVIYASQVFFSSQTYTAISETKRIHSPLTTLSATHSTTTK